ncbi:MAG TPA: DUF4911 domain-containing protein [Candidatus Kryptonia bacterium]|nr:DUF4911 domain-containing protein [Candidatus Kryptonia bacterium]
MRAADIVPIYLRVDPRDIALIKFVIESYEGVGIVRTIERRAAVIVLLAVPDFVPTARAILASLSEQVVWEEVPPPACGDEQALTLS